jgi:hypothetical protein
LVQWGTTALARPDVRLFTSWEDTRNGKRRYWIETAGEPALSG